jgi:hypothetical protein
MGLPSSFALRLPAAMIGGGGGAGGGGGGGDGAHAAAAGAAGPSAATEPAAPAGAGPAAKRRLPLEEHIDTHGDFGWLPSQEANQGALGGLRSGWEGFVQSLLPKPKQEEPPEEEPEPPPAPEISAPYNVSRASALLQSIAVVRK